MAGYTLEPIEQQQSSGYSLEPIEEKHGAVYKTAAALGHAGRVAFETGANLFSGLYAWPASQVAGQVSLLLTGDRHTAESIEKRVANELTVKPQTEEAQYITNQVGKLINIPMEIIGDVSDTAVEMLYSNTNAIGGDYEGLKTAQYKARAPMQALSMPAIMKIAKEGIKGSGKVAKQLPDFLKEVTGRGKAAEIARQETIAAQNKEGKVSSEVDIVQPGANMDASPGTQAIVDTQKATDTKLSERGSFSTKADEPLLHQFPDEIQKRYDAALPKEQTTFEKASEKLETLKNKLTRDSFEHLPMTGEFAELRFELSNLGKYKGVASDSAAVALRDITKQLDRPTMDLFEKKVIVDDLFYSAERGMDLPYGFTRESLAAEKIILDDLVSKNPKVEQAVARRKAAWEQIKQDYVNAMDSIGFNVEERFSNPDYYHHQVLEYAQQNSVYGTGKTLKTPTNRGFLKKREGSELDISRDYLQVEHDVISQMVYDTKVAEAIRLVDERYNIADQLKNQFKDQWEQNIPEGYSTWQPREGNTFYIADTIPSKIAQQLIDGGLSEIGITPDMLQKAIAKGARYKEYVLKDEVIRTLDSLAPETHGIVSESSAWLMRQWKEKVALLHPKGFFKYQARNISGDAEAVFVGNPKAFQKAPQASKELWNAFYGDGKMTPQLRDFFEMGGFESTLQALEINKFADLSAFKHLKEKGSGNIKDIPSTAWKAY